MPSNAIPVLVEALQSNQVARVRDVLAQHPELIQQLNDPLPGLPFDSAAIHHAVSSGNREMIELLLDAGADVNVRTRWWAGGFGVLDSAEPALAPFLIARGARVDAHAAARLGMMDRLRELVGADPAVVHARGGDGQTPLHVAANVEVATYLLDHGADLDARDVDHESTPAQYMIRDRQPVARVLVDRGCRTDLLMAAALGDADRVRHHLDANPSSIRMTVSDRWFPKQNPRSGGTIYIWTLGGHKSAHVIAREFGRAAAFDLLMERSPAPLQLVVACELGDTDLIRTLVTADGAIVRSLDDTDRGAIAAAAERNQAAVVNRMLALGWPTDGRGDFRATALHWAAFHGNAGMVRDLLEHHAAIDVRDPVFDGTPLDWAIHGSLKGWYVKTGDYGPTVEALLAAGSTPPSDVASVNASEAVRAALRRKT